jgi:hypothetical protein
VLRGVEVMKAITARPRARRRRRQPVSVSARAIRAVRIARVASIITGGVVGAICDQLPSGAPGHALCERLVSVADRLSAAFTTLAGFLQ